MAKYKNVFQEASRRFQDFKARGFIPEGAKYAFQDFVNEVTAENRGETYHGIYTAEAYEDAYGVEVDYFEQDTFDDVVGDAFDGKVTFFKDSDYDSVVEEYENILEQEAQEAAEEERKRNLVEIFREQLLDIFNKNDFMVLGERPKWAARFGFAPSDVYRMETLEELKQLARQADKVEGFAFRNQFGRNRRTESSDYATYENDFRAELNAFIDNIQEVIEPF